MTSRRIGAAKLETAVGPVWCHASQLGNTLKLRRYSDGAVYEATADWEDVEDFIPLSDLRHLVEAESYQFSEIEVWTTIFQKLEMGSATAYKEPERRAQEAGERTVVPITELRRMYDVLKVLDTATLRTLAEFYAGTPGSVERLWNRSRHTFFQYRNQEGWATGTRQELPIPGANLEDISSTDQLVAFLQGELVVDGSSYEVVEREVNPWRTTRGVSSNAAKATRSGRGGMDLLLRASASGLPAVCEVKVKNDKNALFALLQAMTYGVELSTPSQLHRLATAFPQFEHLNPEADGVEVVVLLVNPVVDPTREPVQNLIASLNSRGRCEGASRFRLWMNEGEEWQVYD